MPPTVYVETTIFSYLAARPSSNPATAVHQRVTADWWRLAPDQFRLLASAVVLQEARQGDPGIAARRLELLAGLPLLELTIGARTLAEQLLGAGLLPPAAIADAYHVAVAAGASVDYLVSWNLRHLAGAVVRRRIERALRERGYDPPTLCTPEELMGDLPKKGGPDVE